MQEDVHLCRASVVAGIISVVSNTMRVFTTRHQMPLKIAGFRDPARQDAVYDRFREDLGERPNIDTRNPDVQRMLIP